MNDDWKDIKQEIFNNSDMFCEDATVERCVLFPENDDSAICYFVFRSDDGYYCIDHFFVTLNEPSFGEFDFWIPSNFFINGYFFQHELMPRKRRVLIEKFNI